MFYLVWKYHHWYWSNYWKLDCSMHSYFMSLSIWSFEIHFLSDYVRTFCIHINLLSLLKTHTNLMTVRRRRQWHPTPVLLPGKSHGWRSLVGCSPWGREKSDTTEWLHFHFSLSCIGERNGNPLQRSCLENPRDGGAWWAVICGVAQSQTRLKWLSSSSSSNDSENWNPGN